MKISIEIPVDKINLLSAFDISNILLKNNNITECVFYFIKNKNSEQKHNALQSFLSYFVNKFCSIYFSYILVDEIAEIEEIILFSSLLYDEHFVERDSISLEDFTYQLKRAILLFCDSKISFFYKDFPNYANQPFKYSSFQQILPKNNTIKTYSLFCNEADFDSYIRTIVINNENIQYFSEVLNEKETQFLNCFSDLRKKLISQNSLFFNSKEILNIRNISNLFAKDVLLILKKYANF